MLGTGKHACVMHQVHMESGTEVGVRAVTWGGSILFIHVFLQQPPQQQPWEVRPKLTPRDKWGVKAWRYSCAMCGRQMQRVTAGSVGSLSQLPHSSPQVLQPTVPTKGLFLAPPTQLVSHPHSSDHSHQAHSPINVTPWRRCAQ